MTARIKTTEKHFDIFIKECEKWVIKFGLFGWNVRYKHKECSSDTYARIEWNICVRECDITLNALWPEGEVPCVESIRRAAFHEVSHLLLLPLCEFGAKSDSVEIAARRESDEHAVIQRLIRAVWIEDKKT